MKQLFANPAKPLVARNRHYHFDKMSHRASALALAYSLQDDAEQPLQTATPLAQRIQNDQYAFVFRNDAAIGFVSWTRTDRAHAERWLMFNEMIEPKASTSQEAVVLDVVRAQDRGTLSFIYKNVAELIKPPFIAYAKRCYAYGRVRPIRMIVGV